MKKSELVFNIISVPIDALMLFCAGIASFYLRLRPEIYSKPISYELSLKEFLSFGTYIIPLLIMFLAILGLYNMRGLRKFWLEFSKVTIGISLALLVVILMFFFDQTIFPSRFIILSTWGLGIVLILFGRSILRLFQKYLFLQGIGLHRLVIVNGSGGSSKIIEKVYKNKLLGYEVIKEINFSQDIIEKLNLVYKQEKFDEVLQADNNLSDKENLLLVRFTRNKGLAFSYVPNLFDVEKSTIETLNVKGIPVIVLKNTPLDGWGKVAKRFIDIIVSLICLILTSPFFLIIAISIKLNSRGKVIYSALRGGRGKDFRFYKFRSMYSHLSVGEEYGGQQAEKIRQELWQKNDRGGKDAPFLKIKHDPRVTSVGRFLRKTKLDEIPQFWNVLKGDMSMVGPRAHVLDEVERYRNRYQRMFSIKPGIFGMSQIAQVNWPDLPFEEEIKLNTFYIENWSMWLDVKILAKSFWLLFFLRKPNDDY